MKTLLLHFCALFALITSASAEIIGVEQFDYADGAIATKSGGTFWDYKNVAPAGHGGTPSAWENFTGVPTVTAGRLVTNNTAARRKYHPNEFDGQVDGTTVAKVVYHRVTFTTGATLPDFVGLSSYFFTTEQVFFGKPFAGANFAFVKGADTVSTSIAVQANTTYTMVTKLDYVTNTIRLFINPAPSATEPATADASFTFSGSFNPSTAVRLASGFAGSAVTWDGLCVVTSWSDFNTVVTTTADTDDGSLNPALGGGISLREAVNQSPSGSLITFAPALSGKTITLTAGELVPAAGSILTIDGSSLSPGVTIDGNDASRLFSVVSGRTLTLRALALTCGNGMGANDSGSGGALHNAGGILRVIDCTLASNRATNGGAIYSNTDFAAQRTEITRCTITGNTATSVGGGVRNFDGATIITACTFSGNTAPPSGGGGVASYGDGSTLTTINHTVVSANVGGDVVFTNGATNSFTSQGFNLIGDGNATGNFTQLDDQTGVTNPKLSPLGWFGGPTMTLHPLIGSSAIDRGSAVTPSGSDQRGFPAIVDGDADSLVFRDIGAVECGPVSVVSVAGDGAGATLRNTIATVGGAGTPGARILFDGALFPSTTTLSGSEIQVPATARFFIDASNLSGPVIVSGDNARRVFSIPAGASVAMQNVHILNGKALDGGFSSNNGDDAGGILNGGTLNLIACRVAGNRAGRGGFFGGVGGRGGGIFSSGLLRCVSCEIAGNDSGNQGDSGTGSGGSGGGIYSSGAVSLVSSSVTGNHAGSSSVVGFGGDGGGIFSSGPLSIATCTFSGNTAGNGGEQRFSSGSPAGRGGHGGGIFSSGGLSLASSTIAGNTAGRGGSPAPAGGAGGDGGGIFGSGSLRVMACTISGNAAGPGGTGFGTTGPAGNGGGIAGELNTTPLVLQNSIVAQNTAPGIGPDFARCAVTFAGSNLLGNPNGLGSIAGPTPNVADPLLAPLDNYGGPTQTMALKPGSPARDVANGSTRTADQRGFPIIGTPDIGAYEAGTLTNYNAFIWETLPATATAAQHAATFDFDGDGANNGDEFIAGTVVTNPTSVFRVTAISRTGNILSVAVSSVVGRTYGLEYTTELGSPTLWEPIPVAFPGTGSPLTIDLDVTGFTKFFLRPRVGP